MKTEIMQTIDNNSEENIGPIDMIEDENLEENPETEEDAQLQFLHQFTYDQEPQPKKKDVIYYFDLENDFMRAKIISKSNFRYYFNIRFVDLDRPDAGIYLKSGEF